MKNAFKKVFGYNIKHRAQGPKGTGNVLDSKQFKVRKKIKKPKKLPKIYKVVENDNIKLGDVIKFNLRKRIK